LRTKNTDEPSQKEKRAPVLLKTSVRFIQNGRSFFLQIPNGVFVGLKRRLSESSKGLRLMQTKEAALPKQCNLIMYYLLNLGGRFVQM